MHPTTRSMPMEASSFEISISDLFEALIETEAKIIYAEIGVNAAAHSIDVDLAELPQIVTHFRPREIYLSKVRHGESRPCAPAPCAVDAAGAIFHLGFFAGGVLHVCRFDAPTEITDFGARHDAPRGAFLRPDSRSLKFVFANERSFDVGDEIFADVRVNLHLQQARPAENLFTITGHDPQFILTHKQTGAALALPRGRYSLVFATRMVEGRLRRPALFLDIGQGFRCNAGEMFLLNEVDEGEWRVEFEIQSRARLLRIDPSEAPGGTFEVNGLSFRVRPRTMLGAYKQQRDFARERVETSASFCISPFIQAEIMTTGIVKPCCMFASPVSEGEKVMSVYTEPFDRIWNSENLRDVRRRMIFGEAVEQCQNCSSIERRGERSPRVEANQAWSALGWANPHNETLEDLVVTALANDFRMPAGPAWIDLDLGDLCNLKCRMCSPTSSSSIAKDPVHSHWAHFEIGAARWRGRTMVVAPERVQGIEYEGFSSVDKSGGVGVVWFEETAAMRVSRLPERIESVRIKLKDEGARAPLRVFANDTPLAPCEAVGESPAHLFDLPSSARDGGALALRFECSGRVAVEEIALLRAETGANQVAINRLASRKQWHQDVGFIKDEVFRNPERITKVQIVGGEPLLIKEARDVMRALDCEGVSRRISLVLITNGTTLDDEIIHLLGRFKEVSLIISLDGFGVVNDYIRFGSRWEIIESNIRRLLGVENVRVATNCTLQAYNMLHVTQLAEYAERLGLGFRSELLGGPSHLSCFAMPLRVRKKASEKMRRYAEGCRADISETLVRVAAAIEAYDAPFEDGLLRDFMLFTNDLDASRGQDVRVVNQELYDEIEASGVKWEAGLRFAKRADTRDGAPVVRVRQAACAAARDCN